MRATVLAVLLACGMALADPLPMDAPVARVFKGEPAPFDGLLMSDANAIRTAQRATGCEAERDALRTSVTPTAVWVLVIVGVLAAGAGVGLGYGLAKVPTPK